MHAKELGMSILGLEAEKEDLSESESYIPRGNKRRYETDNELTVYETGKRFLPGPHDSVWTILPQNRVPQLTTVGQQKEPRYSERSDGFKHNLLVSSYQQYETEQFLPSFDFLDSNPRSLSGGLEPIETILFFRNASLQRSPPSLPTTAQAVALAIQIVFGDQFSRWQRCMDRALNHAEIPHQPETTLETMIEALSYHNADNHQQGAEIREYVAGDERT
ncbi:hypothetical protein BV898_18603 [Hypsibius exemplaris]|uniref:Uncharacterized protein n=1 Tax=Hypsibius exemplaris TaxID=2072580 RepID=A0A9X6NHW9_HYPEX|nr:hypothetical protein BV898_18603 [Hypsibius exemplaris]